jgi:hypothetical protein
VQKLDKDAPLTERKETFCAITEFDRVRGFQIALRFIHVLLTKFGMYFAAPEMK